MTTAQSAAQPNQIDPSLVNKVRKLLAMAERSPNPNEADAFSRKAAELIAAHRIDSQRLRSEANDDLAVIEVPLGRGAYVRGRLALLQVIGEGQGCRIVFEVRDIGTVAFVAGFRSDLDTTLLLFNSLHTQASSRMTSERRATAAATQQWRRSFLFGYADQIRLMLSKIADQAQHHVHPSNAALPALRARTRRVDEFSRAQFGRVLAARQAKAATTTGWEAGRRAAQRADLGRRRVSGLRAIGRGT